MTKDIVTECIHCGHMLPPNVNDTCLSLGVCPDCLEKYYTQCDGCGEYIKNEDVIYAKEKDLCESCFSSNYITCERCGEYEYVDDAVHITDVDEYWCSHCARWHSYECYICGNVISENEIGEVDGEYVCDDCRFSSDDIQDCDDCNEYHFTNNLLWHDDDECYYCESCYSDHDENGDDSGTTDNQIYGYHTHSRTFSTIYGDTKGNTVPTLGIELEVDGGRNGCDCARKIHSSMPENFVYFERDGSLGNEGFECITYPATMDYHLSIREQYRNAFKACIENGFRSHKTSTCGLHVHFNRTFFGEKESEQEECVLRLLYLVEHFWENLTKFSRRNISSLNRWAGKYDKEPVEIVKDMKNHCCQRYKAINLTNNNTIEFRMFRGTLKLNTFIATLQMVNNLVICAKEKTDIEELRSVTWESLLTTKQLEKYWDEQKDRKIR